MFIIFDLDDTLIETSRTITPYRLKELLKHLQLEKVLDTQAVSALHQLQVLCAHTSTIQEALRIFLAQRKALFLEKKAWLLWQQLPVDLAHMQLVQGAKEILIELQKSFCLALVTRGDQKIQSQKLKKAGLDTGIFSKIEIVLKEKKAAYQRILQQFKANPLDAVVIGDRIKEDLLPAKELGCLVMHFRNGRGKYLPVEEYVDHSITSLSQILSIVQLQK